MSAKWLMVFRTGIGFQRGRRLAWAGPRGNRRPGGGAVTKRFSTFSGAVLLALTATASAGPMSVTSTKLIGPPQITTEPVYYRCNGYYGWDPVGTIAGRTGGWPYFGWYGYPYLSYQFCGCPHYRHLRHYRHPHCYCRQFGCLIRPQTGPSWRMSSDMERRTALTVLIERSR
jgi:hypothetical protein